MLMRDYKVKRHKVNIHAAFARLQRQQNSPGLIDVKTQWHHSDSPTRSQIMSAAQGLLQFQAMAQKCHYLRRHSRTIAVMRDHSLRGTFSLSEQHAVKAASESSARSRIH